MVDLGALPDELRHIQPYLQRGQEVAAADPVVAYFCKYYAARQAIAVGAAGAAEQFVAALLDELEAGKAQLQGAPAMANDEAAARHCTVFALRIFARADTKDREARTDKTTARNFIVASQFLQVVAAFGDLPPDTAEKIRYAKWRAAEILRAVREGHMLPSVPRNRLPAPDAPGQPHQPHQPHQPTPPPLSQPAPAAFVPVPAASVPAPAVGDDGELALDPADAKAAQKFARWAISALEYDDVDTAVTNLQKAIDVLARYRSR
ncbi:hypothetical protein H4R18_000944 [Coemansia javaensis]|uniref:DUF605-domain-containing protein n=1 Tax=Coemansia javaensis TaxID=2761396 RepID=A0A9W8LLE2_9FUNG|nr:hypothetical protein H4R18_000944 [Coemansia javaensis]